MRTATRRYRVTVLTVSNNDFRLYSLASKVRIHTWRRSVPQRGSVGSADTKLHTGLMRTATRRYRVTVLTVSNNDFRLSSLTGRYVSCTDCVQVRWESALPGVGLANTPWDEEHSHECERGVDSH